MDFNNLDSLLNARNPTPKAASGMGQPVLSPDKEDKFAKLKSVDIDKKKQSNPRYVEKRNFNPIKRFLDDENSFFYKKLNNKTPKNFRIGKNYEVHSLISRAEKSLTHRQRPCGIVP